MPPRGHTGPVPEAERPEYTGRYVLETRLGSGGMGVVHLAASASGLRLAVKVIHGTHASDPEFRARFRQEVAAARKVSGAFTAPVVDADPEAERPWMATLFIEGPTLSEQVKRNGPLDSEELIRLGAGLAEGLRDIHRAGVVHRDLKPSNVLLAADGPKVIDFGISRPSDSDLRTETGQLIGTPPFMAPEQFQRPREVGFAADVFAMGAVLVHAATGRGPFDSDSPYIVAYQVVHNEPDLTDVPVDLLPLIERCLAKDPADRPTPDELMTMLGPSSRATRAAAAPVVRDPSRTEGPEDTVRPSTAPPRAGRSRTGLKRRVGWAAAGVVLATAAALAGLGLTGDGGGDGGRGRGAPADTPAKAHAVREFRPWLTTLGGGTGEKRTPVCTVGDSGSGSGTGAAVYCAAPGIAAARLDPVDGHVDWSVRKAKTTNAEAGDLVGGEVAPVLSGGLLQVVSPGAGRLEALDPGTGRTRWDTGISLYPTVRYTPDSVLLMAADGRRVRSLDSATGKERWTRQLDAAGVLWTAPQGDGAPLFVTTMSDDGSTTQVRAIGPGDGTVLWEKGLAGTLNPVAFSGDALFLLSQNTDDATDAVVRLDSTRRTVRRVPLAEPVEQTQAAVSGDMVYLVAYTGSLLAVDTAEPVQRWRLETSVTRSSQPVVAGNRLYLSAGDGRLLAVDRERGVLLGETKARMSDGPHTLVASLPAPGTAPGTVVASAPDGSVFAVDSGDPSGW
ncbi:PQQ-binding-like beta-propeller repeat protein [Streptomyces sp. NPDC088725]|uniref:serine/threonine-protein kinase n=1 Tax=Streptomyces sp. NPDC088725 TaxID=3365873 RepID=UPI00380CC86D